MLDWMALARLLDVSYIWHARLVVAMPGISLHQFFVVWINTYVGRILRLS